MIHYAESERESLQVGCVWRGFKLRMKEFVPYTQRRLEVGDLVAWLAQPQPKMKFESVQAQY